MKKTGKAYFMISVVAQKYNIHPQTLRLYEREGLLKPSRTEGNTRLYSEDDLEQLETILSLTRIRLTGGRMFPWRSRRTCWGRGRLCASRARRWLSDSGRHHRCRRSHASRSLRCGNWPTRRHRLGL